MEQIVRDTRIATLYEGTTGIQALDLLGRKVLLLTRGKAVREFTGQILKFCAQNAKNRAMRPYVVELTRLCAEWNYLTLRLMLIARKDRDMVSSAAVDYLMYAGYVSLGYFWALMAQKSLGKLADKSGAESEEFYRAKVQTAEFYFERLLPRTRAHAQSMLAPSKSVMQLPVEHFSFG